MRKLQKLSIDQELLNNISDWTNQYIALESAGADIPHSLAAKYRDERIKEFLLRETHGKCVYCESTLTHISFGDVEHIVPKHGASHLRYDYGNLTIACSICNNNKSNFMDTNHPIINPYEQHPSTYIQAAGSLLLQRPRRTEGYITINVLKLNRVGLLEKRAERIDRVLLMIEKLQSMKDGDAKEAFKRQIIAEDNIDREFSFVVKSFVEQQLT